MGRGGGGGRKGRGPLDGVAVATGMGMSGKLLLVVGWGKVCLHQGSDLPQYAVAAGERSVLILSWRYR